MILKGGIQQLIQKIFNIKDVIQAATIKFQEARGGMDERAIIAAYQAERRKPAEIETYLSEQEKVIESIDAKIRANAQEIVHLLKREKSRVFRAKVTTYIRFTKTFFSHIFLS